jgi:hypothetical protein
MLVGAVVFTAVRNGAFSAWPSAGSSPAAFDAAIDARIQALVTLGQKSLAARVAVLEQRVAVLRSTPEGTIARLEDTQSPTAVPALRGSAVQTPVAPTKGVTVSHGKENHGFDLEIATKLVLKMIPAIKKANTGFKESNYEKPKILAMMHHLSEDKWTQPVFTSDLFSSGYTKQIECLSEAAVASPGKTLRIVQIGTNDGNDHVHEIVARLNEKHGSSGALNIEITLVEPTVLNFDRLKNNYERNPRMKGVKKKFVNAAVCNNCCAADKTTNFYHPKWEVLKSWEAGDRLVPKNVNADGDWTHKWLYEISSLEEKALTIGHFKQAEVTSTTIGCYNLNEILEMSASNEARKQLGPDSVVDFMLIDTEGYDWDVLSGLDPAEVKPKVVLYERKMLDDHKMGSEQESFDFMKKSGYVVRKANENALCTTGVFSEDRCMDNTNFEVA